MLLSNTSARHRSLIALLAFALLFSGCAGTATPPTVTPASTADSQALQASVEAAARATLVAQAVAATLDVPTPSPRPTVPTATPRVPVLENTEPFRDHISGIAGLKPVGWSIESDAAGLIIRPQHGKAITLTVTLTTTAQLSANGPEAATKDLFRQIKEGPAYGPVPHVAYENYDPDGGSLLLSSGDELPGSHSAVATYVRVKMTERGLLVATMVLPSEVSRWETRTIEMLLDALDLSGDGLTSVPCLTSFTRALVPADAPRLPAASGTLFTEIVTYDGEGSFGASGIGDVNGDGLQDVAMVTADIPAIPDGQIYVFLQGADHTLQAPMCFNVDGSGRGLVMGDLSGDGRDDVVVLTRSDEIKVFRSAPQGVFGARYAYGTGRDPDALVAADLNGDGRADIALSHGEGAEVGVFLQQADGELSPMISLPSTSTNYNTIAIGDVTGDELPDIVRTRGSNPTFEVFPQRRDHTFGQSIGYVADAQQGGVAVGDVTGDGHNDVILGNASNMPDARIIVFEQGAVGLVERTRYPVFQVPQAIRVADIDGDGRNDVVLLHSTWRAVSVLRQQHDGTLAEGEIYPNPHDSSLYPSPLDVGDLNGDGHLDVVAVGSQGFTILYGQAP